MVVCALFQSFVPVAQDSGAEFYRHFPESFVQYLTGHMKRHDTQGRQDTSDSKSTLYDPGKHGFPNKSPSRSREVSSHSRMRHQAELPRAQNS